MLWPDPGRKLRGESTTHHKPLMAFVHPSRSGLVPQDSGRKDASGYDRRRGRSRSRTPPPPRRDRHEDSRSRPDRRSSPSYNDYKRPQTPPRPPADSNAPWRAEGSMYPPRASGGRGFQSQDDTRPLNGGGYRGGGGGGGGYRGGGGADWLERCAIFSVNRLEFK